MQFVAVEDCLQEHANDLDYSFDYVMDVLVEAMIDGSTHDTVALWLTFLNKYLISLQVVMLD